MGAHSVRTSTKRSYVAFVCIQFSMRISSHLSCGKAALTVSLHGESRFSTKSWYMHIHVRQRPDQSACCAVFLALLCLHIPNVNGAD